jgi:hypothetical protein
VSHCSAIDVGIGVELPDSVAALETALGEMDLAVRTLMGVRLLSANTIAYYRQVSNTP